MTDIVFMDTETLGLDPDAPVWEFAAIRCFEDGHTDAIDFRIRHAVGQWLEQLPESFQQDYLRRFRHEDAIDARSAAAMIHVVTRDAHIVGAVPSFDTERLAKLLRRFNIAPAWHYHLIDVENVVVGYIRGLYAAEGKEMPVLPPYDSNELSQAVGVDPEKFERHTAMGDVLWVKAQWDALMGGAS